MLKKNIFFFRKLKVLVYIGTQIIIFIFYSYVHINIEALQRNARKV